jgi:hypothetical protein
MEAVYALNKDENGEINLAEYAGNFDTERVSQVLETSQVQIIPNKGPIIFMGIDSTGNFGEGTPACLDGKELADGLALAHYNIHR